VSGFCEHSNVSSSVKADHKKYHAQYTTLIFQCMIIFTACLPCVEQACVMLSMFKQEEFIY
jgi:hypothetical protein